MVTRRGFARLAALGLAGGTSAAQAQDFGKLFEQAARNSVRKAISPENLQRALTPRDQSIQPYTVKTPDGWSLVANRYRPATIRPGSMPVILCHGLTYSSTFWDLDPSVSFARFLADAGHDVWSVNLRGCGASQKWVFRLDDTPNVLIGGALRRATGGKLAPTGFDSVDPRYANWDLDAHINLDLPTLIRLVRHHTKAEQVAWVGHSMGGIVALAHLARYQNPGIGRLATIGSQLTMRDAQLVLPFLHEMLQARSQQLAGQLTPAELTTMTRTGVNNLFFNVQNVSPRIYQSLSMDRTDIPAIGLMKQYLSLASQGELWDARKQFNYTRSAQNVTVPILITCGSLDRFAPPTVQQDLYRLVGSTDKTYVVFGRAMGYAADSGHDDAIVGLTSRQQVFPAIERWIRGEKLT